MAKDRNYTSQYIIILILTITIAGILLYVRSRSNLNVDLKLSPDFTVIDNPLMGLAPDASNISKCDETRLVYISLTWAEWEPEEGRFDIEGLEKRCNILRWKESGKHAVLRFICDLPGETKHMDIPEWLYEKAKKGTFYDTEIGKGYSPDYSDAIFMKYHKKAIEALAEYCNSDYFVSFVELGSLGHWGEWHVQDSRGRTLMPGADICNEYARVYSDSFVKARLLTRRNYDFSVNGNIGVYNDMVGDKTDTGIWLDWLKNGGTQKTSGKELTLKPSPDMGLKCPVGGEFTSGIPMDEMLGDEIGDVLQDVTTSRMTFIGPKVPDFTSEKYALATESVIRRMGYRIYPSHLKMKYDFSDNAINMELSFRNAGNAGFFYDWPVTVYVFDENRKRVFWQGLDIDLRNLSADIDVSASVQIPFVSEISDEFYVGINITDYDGGDSVKLAVDPEQGSDSIDDVQIIYHYKRNND